ncbi:MAG: CoA transferase [Chloroflexi bacterium]|nr:CoA transferase [Chloroflexota bacterium]MCH8350757.1 CoA transferase [Chloroflexota bacterium]MCI0779857.1 CoA transferase [Chloroflexota bacterium]MCI0785202.1 CoA transferase [Chloroflexota bacterium]MCI0792728.1 CoA transferase [Chloroflexota bacterium]
MTDLPLSGIRVTDLSRVFAMPYAGAYLADLGAEVIKVDSCQAQFMDTTRTLNGPYPDNDPGELHWERGGTFQTLNRGKRSLTLDLRSETAVGLLKDLVRVSDIVLENFTPRVMNRFGLDYASLRAVKPDLIMVSNTGYGHSGPWSNFGAMATALEPTHGTGAFIGYQDSVEDGRLTEGSVPNKIGNSYTDFLASWTAQLAVMASLLHRARTGRGMWIDLAMYQVGVSFMGAGVLDYAFNGRRTNRIGNRHGAMAPHGCYPCRGNDEWVTIAVRDDADWVSFCQALGQPSLAADPRFATAQTRLGHQEELDAIIAAWTGEQGQYQVMENLQARGVPAGPVLNARGMLSDPQFRARGFFEPVDHPPETGLGRREYIGRGWKLSNAKVAIQKAAPMLGEANDYVLGQVLGLDTQAIRRLEQDGVIGQAPSGAASPTVVPLDRQVELGWIVEHDA